MVGFYHCLCCLRATFKITLLMMMVPVANADCFRIDAESMAKALNAKGLSDLISIESAHCSSIALGTSDVTFELSEATEKIHNGIRSEVAVDYPFEEGDAVTYQISIKLPKAFQTDSPENRWWLITQWHDQPDKRIGETWYNFPALSPPVAIYVEERGGVPGIGVIMYGNQKRSWMPVPLGEWLTLRVQIRWSMSEDGLVDFKVLEHPEFNVKLSGRNMNNAYQHYLKFGQYRHPGIKLRSRIMFKKLNISK